MPSKDKKDPKTVPEVEFSGEVAPAKELPVLQDSPS